MASFTFRDDPATLLFLAYSWYSPVREYGRTLDDRPEARFLEEYYTHADDVVTLTKKEIMAPAEFDAAFVFDHTRQTACAFSLFGIVTPGGASKPHHHALLRYLELFGQSQFSDLSPVRLSGETRYAHVNRYVPDSVLTTMERLAFEETLRVVPTLAMTSMADCAWHRRQAALLARRS